MSVAADGRHAWAVGNYTVLATADGLDHWRPIHNVDPAIPENQQIFRLVKFDPNGPNGWAIRDDGAVFHTTDVGKSWSKQDSGVTSPLYGSFFDVQGQRGWAVGGFGTIIGTYDAGAHWITYTNSNISQLNSVYLHPAGLFAVAVGGVGIILATSDGGLHWAAQNSGITEILNGVYFLADKLHGWAVGRAGTLIATVDGGEHWRTQQTPISGNWNAVVFESSGQLGWVIGDSGKMLITRNGGQEWNALALPIGSGEAIYFEPQGVRGWIAALDGIYASTDSGRTWQKQFSTVERGFLALWFDPTGTNGWAVGNSGEIAHTVNGGQSWQEQDLDAAETLTGVKFLDNGQQGWIVGTGGLVLTTTDGGKSWSPARSEVGSTLLSLALAGNGSVGWAVGYPPALVRMQTDDKGVSWKPIQWPLVYRKYPAPWFWLTLIVAAICFWRSIPIDRASATGGIESLGTTDAPVADFALDRLQFGSLARGISRFLRNVNTRPPLTLTISGDWGSGKSTLMELVCTDLRHYGIKPVWFNAWHHQQEEELLAALLSEIREKGLPSIFSADGLAFRFRLLLLRSTKYSIITIIVVVALLAWLVGYLFGHDFSEWSKLWDMLSALGIGMAQFQSEAGKITPTNWGALGLQIGGASTAFYSLYRGLSAFKVDPAVLLSTTAENFRLKDASAQTSFRTKFATEFEEVTSALPYTMVILIDDLDRCQPSTVLTIMEAVNFLVSSGKCFVIFGMATNRVEASLAIEFDKIADELAEADQPPGTADNSLRQRRLNYVRDYLDKLINLEIVVPNRPDMLPQLLDDVTDAKVPIAAIAIRRGLELWPAWVAGLVMIFAMLFGFEYRFPDVHTHPAPVVASASQETVAAIVSQAPNQAVDLAPIKDINVAHFTATVQDNGTFKLDELAVSITFAFIVAIAGIIAVYGLRASSRRVYDSQAFRDALRNWMPVVQCRRVTPRGIKRFGNRLRYLAMLQQRGSLDETGFDKLRAGLTGWTTLLRRGNNPAGQQPADVAPEQAMTEPLLVALAALYEVYGSDWEASLTATGIGPLQTAIQMATKVYQQSTHGGWPPSAADLETFQQLLKGIRLA